MKYVISMDDVLELNKKEKSKIPIVIDTIDEENKKIDITTDYLLFVSAITPTKIFLNKTNAATLDTEIASKKRDLEYLKAKKVMQIADNVEIKNQPARDAKLIIDLYEDKEYNKLKDELQALLTDKGDYERLAEYHKNISYMVSQQLNTNKMLIEADKELTGGSND